MCGSRAGWKTYCSINHVPFFSATHSTRRLSETEATFCQPLCKKCEGDKYSSEQIQSLVELHLFWYLNLFQIMFPLLVSSLADTVLTISIYQEPERCAVFKQNPFSPVLYIKWKDTGRRRRGMSICVCLKRKSFFFPFPRCYVWHTSWLLPQLLPLGSAYVTHLYARNPLVTS